MLPIYFLKVSFDRQKQEQVQSVRRKEKHSRGPQLQRNVEAEIPFHLGLALIQESYFFNEAQHRHLEKQNNNKAESKKQTGNYLTIMYRKASFHLHVHLKPKVLLSQNLKMKQIQARSLVSISSKICVYFGSTVNKRRQHSASGDDITSNLA